MNDALLTLAVALTSARHGATIANYVAACRLLRCKDKIIGAVAKDMITNDQICIKAKCIINATGPFSDCIRKMDDKNAPNMCIASCGVHITLPGTFLDFTVFGSSSATIFRVFNTDGIRSNTPIQ